MRERTLTIGMYRILRKIGVPREEVVLDGDFDRDYFFTVFEKNMLFNSVELKYEIEFTESEENQLHNPEKLMQLIKEKMYN